MTERTADINYWKQRIKYASTNDLHKSVFHCPLETWQAIEAKHRDILSHHTRVYTNILDCGCGYGRILNLMPKSWEGDYLGIDFSPDFINLCHKNHPTFAFLKANLTALPEWIRRNHFNLAIVSSIRPMVLRNSGQECWSIMEEQIRLLVPNILYLEYDPLDEGSLE